MSHAAATASSTSSGNSTRSSAAAPAGIIGKQCSTRVDAGVDDGRAAARQRLLEHCLDLFGPIDGEAGCAIGLGETRVVRHLVRQVNLREAFVEEHVLPLADHPEVAVVHDHDHDRQSFEHGGRELLPRHLEAAVAVDADDGGFGAGGLGADRGGDAVAHRPEAS